jgi:hypothetical protein
MAKTTATNGTSNRNPTGNAEVPNAARKSRIRAVAASPTPDGKPAGKATGKTVALGNTGDAAGAGKMPAAENKASIVLKKLNSAKGATIEAMMQATGWQAHSVRGFLSAVVRKKLGHNLISEAGKDGVRRYRIHSDGKAA